MFYHLPPFSHVSSTPGTSRQKKSPSGNISMTLCSAQVCARASPLYLPPCFPPPAIQVWPSFEGGVHACVCVQVFAIITALRGTKCG